MPTSSPKPPRRSSGKNVRPTALPSAKKSYAGVWVTLLMALAAGGAGYYYMAEQQRAEQEAMAARARAEQEAAARRAEEEEEERRRAAEEEARRQREAEAARLAAEEEEARKRREAEEAERRRKAQEEVVEPPAPVEDEPDEPAPTEPEPEKSVYEQELPLVGSVGNSKEVREAFAAMVRQMLEKGEFETFADAFAGKIRHCAPELVQGEKMSYSSYRNSKVLATAMDLCLLIEMAEPAALQALTGSGAGGDNAGEPGTAGGREFLQWALADKSRPLHNFLKAFELNGGLPENVARSLKTWHKLWVATPEKEREKYLNLAIACALLRPEVARSSGLVRNPETPVLSVPEVYDYFREMDSRKKLLVDVKKASVSQLLHVVDVRLPRSEFDWVQKNMSYPQAQWGKAYGSIRYLMTRAANGKDPYTHYTFAELRKEGGVCRDQGYFAATTAKCKGIPAVYIVGDGDRGPHAWIASLVDAHTWKQTGSYGYNSGRFPNPCSGRSQHESVLLSQSKLTSDERLTAAAEGMIVSDYLSRIGCAAEARAAAKYVTTAFPRLTAAWANRLKVLTIDPEDMPDEETWRQVSRELGRLGSHNAELLDFAAEIESGHLMAGKSVASQKSAMKRSLRKLQRNVGNQRSDLVLEAIERQAVLLVEAQDKRGLAALYKKQLKENTGRGDVFQSLLGSYMRHMTNLEATEREWGSLAKEVESIFEKGVYTGTREHFKLKKEVVIQKMVAEAYRKAGNERKAEKLHQAADNRLLNSNKRYQED